MCHQVQVDLATPRDVQNCSVLEELYDGEITEPITFCL